MNLKQKETDPKKLVDEWNLENTVGQAVYLTRDDGSVIETKTRSKAFVADSLAPVIFIEGIRGYYLLTRIERKTC